MSIMTNENRPEYVTRERLADILRVLAEIERKHFNGKEATYYEYSIAYVDDLTKSINEMIDRLEEDDDFCKQLIERQHPMFKGLDSYKDIINVPFLSLVSENRVYELISLCKEWAEEKKKLEEKRISLSKAKQKAIEEYENFMEEHYVN